MRLRSAGCRFDSCQGDSAFPGRNTVTIHWGSFIVGVVATLVCGGLVALIIGVFNGGADDIF